MRIRMLALLVALLLMAAPAMAEGDWRTLEPYLEMAFALERDANGQRSSTYYKTVLEPSVTQLEAMLAERGITIMWPTTLPEGYSLGETWVSFPAGQDALEEITQSDPMYAAEVDGEQVYRWAIPLEMYEEFTDVGLRYYNAEDSMINIRVNLFSRNGNAKFMFDEMLGKKLSEYTRDRQTLDNGLVYMKENESGQLVWNKIYATQRENVDKGFEAGKCLSYEIASRTAPLDDLMIIVEGMQ